MSQYFRYPPAASISLSNYALETGGNLEDIKNILDAGTVTVTGDWLTDAELRASPVAVSAASLPLPTGAATETTQLNVLNELDAIQASTDSIDTKLPVGLTVTSTRLLVDGSGVTQPVSGTVAVSNFPATQPVSGTVAATQSGTWNITNVSGTVSLPTGAATESTLSTLNGKIPSNLTVTSTRLLVDGSGVTQPVSGTVTSTQIASSSSVTSVASSATSVSILALNSSRRGAMFFNESTQICYLKLGTTASVTSYTVQIAASGYYELPPGYIYTGAIDAIWASANGNLRVTELS